MKEQIKKLNDCIDLSVSVFKKTDDVKIIVNQVMVNQVAIMQSLIKVMEELNRPQ